MGRATDFGELVCPIRDWGQLFAHEFYDSGGAADI
jgi:hypothetical protein